MVLYGTNVFADYETAEAEPLQLRKRGRVGREICAVEDFRGIVRQNTFSNLMLQR